MGFEKTSNKNQVYIDYYQKQAQELQNRILEYEKSCNDRTSEKYEAMFFERDMYELISNGYEAGKIDGLLTKEEQIEFARQELESFKKDCPYWEKYETARTKLIEAEKTQAFNSDEYKNALQEYKYFEHLVTHWDGEDNPYGIEEHPDMSYADLQVENGWGSKSQDEISLTFTKSQSLYRSKDNKFNLNIGGNTNIYDNLGADKETLGDHISNASATGEVSTSGHFNKFSFNATASERLSPNFNNGLMSASSDVNLRAFVGSEKFKVGTSYEYNKTLNLEKEDDLTINKSSYSNVGAMAIMSTEKFEAMASYVLSNSSYNEELFHSINSNVTYRFNDTTSLTTDFTHNFSADSNSNSYSLSLNYRLPNDKISLSGQVSYSDGQETPSVFIKGKFKF